MVAVTTPSFCALLLDLRIFPFHLFVHNRVIFNIITNVGRRHFFTTIVAGNTPATVYDGGDSWRRCHRGFPDIFNGRKLMWFSDVDLQTGLRFEMILTLVTWKSCTLTGLLLVSYNLLLFICRFEEIISALRVPPKCGWAGLLLGCQGFLAPGIQSEGEGDPMLRENWKAFPWLLSAWQKVTPLVEAS